MDSNARRGQGQVPTNLMPAQQQWKSITQPDISGQAAEMMKGLVGALHTFTFHNTTEHYVKLLLEGGGGWKPGYYEELGLQPGEKKVHSAEPENLQFSAAFVNSGQYKVFKLRVHMAAGATVTAKAAHFQDPEHKFVTAPSFKHALDMAMSGPMGMLPPGGGPMGPRPMGTNPMMTAQQTYMGPGMTTGPCGQGMVTEARLQQGPPVMMTGALQTNVGVGQQPPGTTPLQPSAVGGYGAQAGQVGGAAQQMPQGFIPMNGRVLCFSANTQGFQPAQILGLAINSQEYEAGCVFVSYSNTVKVVRPTDFAKVLLPAPAD